MSDQLDEFLKSRKKEMLEKIEKEKMYRFKELKRNDFLLRKLLWLNHGCPVMGLYGDDGEMQCGQKHITIDFLRMSADVIKERLHKKITLK